MLVAIYGGLGGVFDESETLRDVMEIRDSTELDIEGLAREYAEERYMENEGSRGIMSYQDCLEEFENDDYEPYGAEESAEDMYREEINGWITYSWEEIVDKKSFLEDNRRHLTEVQMELLR